MKDGRTEKWICEQNVERVDKKGNKKFDPMESVSVHINARTGKVQRVKIAPMKANPKDKTVTSK